MLVVYACECKYSTYVSLQYMNAAIAQAIESDTVLAVPNTTAAKLAFVVCLAIGYGDAT